MSSTATAGHNVFEVPKSGVDLLPTSLRPPAIGEEKPKNSPLGKEDDDCESYVIVRNKNSSDFYVEPVLEKSNPEDRPYPCNKISTGFNDSAYDAFRHETKLDLADCTTTPAATGFVTDHSPYAPDFRENYPGLSCLRWAESLEYLLEDSDGVKLLKEFLDVDVGCSDSLDFWFACTGLKMVDEANVDRIVGLVKLIYKKYIRSSNLQLKSDVKKRIVERVRKLSNDRTIFDEAQREIEGQLCNETYPQFLKSDIYLQYIQSEGDANSKPQGGSSNSSGSDGVHTGCGGRLLATVPEGEELMGEDLVNTTLASSLSLTSSALLATRRLREGVTVIDTGNCSRSSKLSNPYHVHVSYAPVSAQDSELQSLSSDALTDDTMSYTDSSLDNYRVEQHPAYGGGGGAKSSLRKQMKVIRRYADTNKFADLNHQQFIPRTGRLPVDCNLSETNTHQFASLLNAKLLEVKQDRENDERLQLAMQSIHDSVDDGSTKDKPCIPDSFSAPNVFSHRHVNPAEARPNTALHNPIKPNVSASINSLGNSIDSYPYTSILFATSAFSGSVGSADESAQSILDDHVSLIWNSAGPTPSRSPAAGRLTPDRNLLANSDVVHAAHLSSNQKHFPVKLSQKDGGKAAMASASNIPYKDTKIKSSSIWTKEHHRSTQPVQNQPAHNQPVHVHPVHNQSVHNPLVHNQSVHNSLVHNHSVHNNLTVHNHPVHYQPIHNNQPIHNSQSIHNQPIHSNQPIHNNQPLPVNGVSIKRAVQPNNTVTVGNTNALKSNRSLSAQRPRPDLPLQRTHHSDILNKVAPSPGGTAWVPSALGRGGEREKSTVRTGGRKTSAEMTDISVNVDPRSHELQALNLPDVLHDRVLMWMRDNDTLSGLNKPAVHCSTDGSDKTSSQKRSSHKSTGSSGKKDKTKRSESLDRSKLHGVNLSMFSESSLAQQQKMTGGGNFKATATGGGGLTSAAATSNIVPGSNSHVLRQEADARHVVLHSGDNKMRSLPADTQPSFTHHQAPSTTTTQQSASHHQSSSQALLSRFASTVSRFITPQPVSVPSSTCAPPATTTTAATVQNNHGPVQPDMSAASTRRSNGNNTKTINGGQPVAKKPESIVIGYYFCDEPIPYRSTLPSATVTLGQFKEHISKKGNYRYYFKTFCDEFDSGVVHEEVTSDDAQLPLWEGKIVCKVERVT